MRGTIVAIEGLDGTGKSTTVRLLAEALGASVVRNPPTSIAAERDRADRLPPDERRAWYLRANALAMRDARAIAATARPVVLDRSVASTLVFGAAERGSVAVPDDVPRRDLLPDAIVLLDLAETERLRRHRARGDVKTAEEGRLATDHEFRERVMAGYRRLCTHSVSAALEPARVIDEILRTVMKLR